MSASVSVGFSPSPTSLVTPPGGGAASADAADAGGGGLFSALLALVGAEVAPAISDAADRLPSVATELAGLIDAIAPEAMAPPLVEDGKSALKSLGDALTALADSLEAGKPVDPAAEKRLREALDAVGLYLGGLPAALAQATPTEATAPDPAIDRLAGLVEKLGQALAPSSPELSERLSGVAAQLRSGGVTADMLRDLGLSGDVDGDIEKLLAAFAAPRPATRAPEPSPIAAPVLPSADAVTDGDAVQGAQAASPTATAAPPGAGPATSPPPQLEVRVATEAAAPKPEVPSLDEPVGADAPDEAAKADAAAAVPAQQATAAGGVAGATRVAHAAYQSPVQQINFPQVAFEVVRHFEAENSRFQIRLDPPELGRIDVRLDMDKHGTVNARMIVERPETLDLMQRDQRALQQALNQAGLDTSRANLEFSLRQNPFGPGQNGGQGQGQASAFTQAAGGGEDDVAPLAEAVTTLYRGTASAGGVNLFV